MSVSACDDDGDDVVASEFEDEPQMHDGIPITGWYRGEPIPDLNALPRERWLEVLRPLSFWPRRHAIYGVRTIEDSRAATQISGQLILEDGTAAASRFDIAPPRMPVGEPPARGGSRQVNFRLGPNEHARLAEAAKLFAMRPTTLARTLTMRGVARALYEERRGQHGD